MKNVYLNLIFVAVIAASVCFIVLFVKRYMVNVSQKYIKQNIHTDFAKSNIDRDIDTDLSTIVPFTSSTKHYICPQFVESGRLGNLIFIYASNYGIARLKGMQLYIDKSCPLLKLFKIDTTVINGPQPCKKVRHLAEYLPVAYDEKMLNFTNNTDVQLLRFLQSYHYFDAFSTELRQIYQFRDDIRAKVDSFLQTFKRTHGLQNKSITLIGVHVRRGDLLDVKGIDLGKTMATKEYLKTAVDWYRMRYKNVLFIVASDGMNWTKQNMPKNILVSYLEGNSPDIDLATIGSCNHFIMTVGTFGWWSGWLTGGNVTYYKWPARENSTWRKLFIYSDYYYPNWIGL